MSAPIGGSSDGPSTSFQDAVAKIAALRAGTQPKPEEQEAEAEAPPPSDTSNAVVEGDDLGTDAEPTEPPAEGEAPAEEAALETLDDVAKAYGTDVPTLTEQLKVTLPDGTKVPLKAVIDAHAQAPQMTQARAEIEAVRIDLARREIEVNQLRNERLGQMQQATEEMLAFMDVNFANIDLARLEQEDPVQFLTVTRRIDAMQGAMRHAIQLRDGERQRLLQSQAAETQAAAQTEAIKLTTLPDWNSQEKSEKNVALIARYLKAQGKTFDDWRGEKPDHMRVQIALDAARYWELKHEKAPITKKRVAGLPPVTRPGARAEQSIAQVEHQKKRVDLIKKHQQVGTINSAADAIAALRRG